MVNKRANNVNATKSLIIELEDRAKRMEEVSGKRSDKLHEMSAVVGILNMGTLNHTAPYQASAQDIQTLKRKVMEFTNMMANSNHKDLLAIDRAEESKEEEWEDDENLPQDGWLNSTGKGSQECHKFGQSCNWARECPQQGKGK